MRERWLLDFFSSECVNREVSALWVIFKHSHLVRDAVHEFEIDFDSGLRRGMSTS